VYILRWAARLWVGVLLATVLLVGLLLVVRLLLPLPLWSPAPALVQSTPADGATAVLPRASVVLRFNAPMNRSSVARALHVEPSLDVVPIWNDDATTLTLSPTQSLQPDTTYRGTTFLQPLEQPQEVVAPVMLHGQIIFEPIFVDQQLGTR